MNRWYLPRNTGNFFKLVIALWNKYCHHRHFTPWGRRSRKMKWLAKGHTASEWQSQDFSSGSLAPEPIELTCHTPVKALWSNRTERVFSFCHFLCDHLELLSLWLFRESSAAYLSGCDGNSVRTGKPLPQSQVKRRYLITVRHQRYEGVKTGPLSLSSPLRREAFPHRGHMELSLSFPQLYPHWVHHSKWPLLCSVTSSWGGKHLWILDFWPCSSASCQLPSQWRPPNLVKIYYYYYAVL